MNSNTSHICLTCALSIESLKKQTKGSTSKAPGQILALDENGQEGSNWFTFSFIFTPLALTERMHFLHPRKEHPQEQGSSDGQKIGPGKHLNWVINE